MAFFTQDEISGGHVLQKNVHDSGGVNVECGINLKHSLHMKLVSFHRDEAYSGRDCSPSGASLAHPWASTALELV